MKNCSVASCLMAVIAVFTFMYGYDFLVNKYWLMSLYEQTPQLWRTEPDMQQYAPWFLVRYLAYALVITCLYKKLCFCNTTSCSTQATDANACKKPCRMKKSLCFGMKVGAIIGITQASSYIWMPISSTLALAWFITSLVQGMGIGLVLYIICKKKEGCAA